MSPITYTSPQGNEGITPTVTKCNSAALLRAIVVCNVGVVGDEINLPHRTKSLLAVLLRFRGRSEGGGIDEVEQC